MTELHDLKLQAYCPKCKRTSWIEVSMDELNLDVNNQSDSGVPVPFTRKASNSGVFKRSLSHGDHILLLEIDKNGTVRKEHVVSLVSSMVENIVTQTVERIIQTDKTPESDGWTMLYASYSTPFRNFFKSVLSILMLNIENESSFHSRIEHSHIEIFYNRLRIIEGGLDKLREHYKGKKVTSLTIDLGSLEEHFVIEAVKNFSLQDSTITIAYNSRNLGRTPTILLNYLIGKGYSNISLFDYATGQGLSNIIEASFENILR